MVLFPNGGLGRLIFVIIIITTLSYVVLNLVSFGGNRWISYVDIPVRFGLWTVCDTRGPGLCNQWSDYPYISNFTNATFNGNKPNFVRSSQALEIISLIFYIIAAALIVVGIIDLEAFPLEIAFLVAAALLFICIVFLSTSLGLMSAQGRSNHPLAFLDWAWWNGLVGLLMTIFSFFSLLSFLAYMRFSSSFSSMETSPKAASASARKGIWGRSPSPSTGMAGRSPPILPANFSTNQPYNYPYFNPYSPQYSTSQFFQDPLMSYGGRSPFGEYSNDQSPSPLISELARQYVFQSNDGLYQRQLLQPYGQYLQDPYLINNYL